MRLELSGFSVRIERERGALRAGEAWPSHDDATGFQRALEGLLRAPVRVLETDGPEVFVELLTRERVRAVMVELDEILALCPESFADRTLVFVAYAPPSDLGRYPLKCGCDENSPCPQHLAEGLWP